MSGFGVDWSPCRVMPSHPKRETSLRKTSDKAAQLKIIERGAGEPGNARCKERKVQYKEWRLERGSDVVQFNGAIYSRG